MRKRKKMLGTILVTLLLTMLLTTSALASSGNVAGPVETAWSNVSEQVKAVVNNVVFPALDMVLVIAFFGKVAMAYFDYKKHGQFEWTGPVVLFACLVFTLTAPLYIWTIIA